MKASSQNQKAKHEEKIDLKNLAEHTASPSCPNHDEEIERIMERFAVSLGSNSSIERGPGVNSYELSKLLSKDASNPIGGGVCILPSFDIHSRDIPGIPDTATGESKPKCNEESSSRSEQRDGVIKKRLELAKPSTENKVNIPPMTASVFGQCPMSLKKNKLNEKTTTKEDNNENSPTSIDKAATSLGSKMTWTQSSAHLAPSAMLRSLSNSFKHFIETRFKACTLFLLKHSLSNGDEKSRNNFLKLLATSNGIKVNRVVTKFQTLKLPPELLLQSARERALHQTETNKDKNNHLCEIVCPLLFEATTDVQIQSKEESFKIRTAGTLKGRVDRRIFAVEFAEVDLDTASLASSMVENARKVVYGAVAKMTSTAKHIDHFKKPKNVSSNNQSQASRPPCEPQSLLRKRKIATPQNPTQKDKLTAIEKKRSVTWDNPIELQKTYDNSVKKRKLHLSASQLKSSKSFGKPDASLFQSQKNATFAEFGRSMVERNFNGSLSNNRNSTINNLHAFKSKLSTGYRNANFSQASLSLSNKTKLGSRSSNKDLMRTIDLFFSKRKNVQPSR